MKKLTVLISMIVSLMGCQREIQIEPKICLNEQWEDFSWSIATDFEILDGDYYQKNESVFSGFSYRLWFDCEYPSDASSKNYKIDISVNFNYQKKFDFSKGKKLLMTFENDSNMEFIYDGCFYSAQLNEEQLKNLCLKNSVKKISLEKEDEYVDYAINNRTLQRGIEKMSQLIEPLHTVYCEQAKAKYDPNVKKAEPKFAPITTTKIETQYDSLKNICKLNIMQMEGQTLYFWGGDLFGEFHHFYLQKQPGGKETRYKNLRYDFYYTPAEAIIGNYYLVKEVEKREVNDYFHKEKVENEYNVLLQDVETKESFYWYIDFRSEYDNVYAYGSNYSPNEIIRGKSVIGFCEKLRERYVGKIFKIVGSSYDCKYKEYCTEDEIEVEYGTLFRCVDVESNSLVFSNVAIGKILVPFDYRGNVYQSIELGKYNYLVKKYGEKYAEKIAVGWPEVGMTKEMFLEFRGEPEDVKDIKKTKGSFGVREEWKSHGTTYTFENDVLIAFN